MPDCSNPPCGVLFVCLGNICRSPMAHGVMQALVDAHGLSDRIRVDSAGTLGDHTGEPPDERARQTAAQRGYRLDSVARQVCSDDLERFDLIVAMDQNNLRYLRRLDRDGSHDAKLMLLSRFLPAGGQIDVPDPYFGGDRGFETALDLIEGACPAILERLLEP